MARILIIDDEASVCRMLSTCLRRKGHETTSAFSLLEALELARRESFDVVFLDVVFPEGSGLDVLPELKVVPSSPEVIVMTGHANADGADLAIRSGAWDYIEKGKAPHELALALTRALEYREQKLAARAIPPFNRERIVGNSPQLQHCLELAAHAARHDTNVLLTGETGTGKELLARAIHQNSARKNGPFVVVDCAALPETLVEGILFGHEKGAFTGAESRSSGLIEQANGGTLSLEEVGELPLTMQRRFLRVLAERHFRRVGGQKEVSSDFRLMATTNRDLDEMVRKGQFRQDLLHRLRVFSIQLPPLRVRREDMSPLALYLVDRICRRLKTPPLSCSQQFLAALSEYSWPGNVRELAHALERAVAACDGSVLHGVHLPPQIRSSLAQRMIAKGHPRPKTSPASDEAPLGTLREVRESAVAAAEKQYLQTLLTRTDGDIKACCRTAGLSRARLYALLQKHGLSRHRQ